MKTLLDILYKPYFEYNLLDSIVVFGLIIAAIAIYLGIKLLMLTIKFHRKRRRK